MVWQVTTNGEGLLGEAIKISIIDKRRPMSTLKVVASRIMALKVANAGGRSKSKAQDIGNVGGLGFGPDVAVVTFIHSVHGLGLSMRGRGTNWGEDKHHITIKLWGQEIHLLNSQGVII
jgi:hypothetical protein